MLQNLFSSGVIKYATDFKVIKEVADVSGLDFTFLDEMTAVYHTKVSFFLCFSKYLDSFIFSPP